MRHCGVSRNSYFETPKKIPLNTIVLPPLDNDLIQNGAQLVLVNKTKSGVNGEIVTLSRTQDGTPRIIERTSENVRVAQLEQNIKFLQDQHHVMLNDLHNEIEVLRSKNRDLQFQVIFARNQPTSPQISSSTSSSDDEHKIFSSPTQPPFTSSLHVELLEKMIGDLKIQLQENESRNVYLSAIVDEQKKKLERYERDRERERERALQAEPELRRKVEEADAIIRRLQQENNALRRENSASISPSHYHHRDSYHAHRADGQHQNRENGHREMTHHHAQQNHHQNGSYQKGGRGNRRNNSSNFRGNWFPPLHSQNYWQGGGNRSGNGEKRNNGDGTLPNLNGSHHQDRRNGGNNNHHHNGDGVRHQGNQSKSVDPP